MKLSLPAAYICQWWMFVLYMYGTLCCSLVECVHRSEEQGDQPERGCSGVAAQGQERDESEGAR